MTRKDACLVLSGLCAGLVSVELYLRRFPPPNVYMNTRNIVQQSHAMPDPDPELAYRWIPGLKKRFRNLEFDTMVTIDSRGFRGKEAAAVKPAGWKRIVVAGDSFPFGWGVEDGETVGALLEKSLAKTEVINQAVAGYCTSQSIRWFERNLPLLQPDMLILFTWGTPSGCVPEPVRIRDGRLVGQDDSGRRYFLYKNVYLYTFLLDARYELKSWFSPPPEPAPVEPAGPLSEELKSLDALDALSRKNRFKILLVHFPDEMSVLHDPPPEDLKTVDELRALILKKGWGFLDLTPALRGFYGDTGKSPYFRHDDHWNVHGHQVAAQAIAKALR